MLTHGSSDRRIRLRSIVPLVPLVPKAVDQGSFGAFGTIGTAPELGPLPHQSEGGYACRRDVTKITTGVRLSFATLQ
jgi:hypothetical protein